MLEFVAQGDTKNLFVCDSTTKHGAQAESNERTGEYEIQALLTTVYTTSVMRITRDSSAINNGI